MAHDEAGNPNLASTSTDNSVAYGIGYFRRGGGGGGHTAERNLDSTDKLVVTWAVNDAESVGEQVA